MKTTLPEPATVRPYLAQWAAVNAERRAAAVEGRAAFRRLLRVMEHKTGQGYKLRALLYSLYNGQPASLLDAITLDWAIRKDLNLVLLGFGCEFAGDQKQFGFFYDAMKTDLQQAGLFDWFVAQFDYQTKP